MLVFSLIAVCGSTLTLAGVKATSKVIHQEVPTFQGYGYVDKAQKSTTGSTGSVNLSTKENEAVTFSARATTTSGYGSGVTVKQTNRDYVVNYAAIYGAGQEMQARYRNANWTNNTGLIIGWFNYQ